MSETLTTITKPASGLFADDASCLRFITCGSVDDGKSTLIGRLLYESNLVFDDQLTELEVDSRRVGTQGSDLDLALLVDGLQAEREQGITIDVAYRYFSTSRRRFIVADTPGHEQYTRNMATGASTAELAIVLVDARKGTLTQTRRHTYIVSLLGISRIVLAVNKLDLVGYSEEIFNSIEAEYRQFCERLDISSICCIPLSALRGDNVTARSSSTPWYEGPTLLEHLETVDVDQDLDGRDFRMPVQWVNRPNHDFRGYAGRIVSGSVRRGDRVIVLPSRQESRIARIVTYDGDLAEASVGQSVTITLNDETDVSRGDVFALLDSPPEVADQFETHIIWMHETAMRPNHRYLMRIGTRIVGITIAPPKYKIDMNSLGDVPTPTLELNEIGLCDITLDRLIPFDLYADCREMGGFIILDRLTNDTVGAGLLRSALRTVQNVRWQSIEVNKSAHARLKHQVPAIVWLTGLSGAGKSTIANVIERKLHDRGKHTYLIDGDNVRHGLSRDLGFTDADRDENIRRVAEVAALMVDSGLIVLVSLISPFKAQRRTARELVESNEFIEVFVDTPLEEAERRDPKGLYKRARRGEMPNFTGVDSPYEPPEAPEVWIETSKLSPEQAADKVIRALMEREHLG